jgi:acetoin:2,6-dichlorophenolindophenol oxidoreductase subunit alpha
MMRPRQTATGPVPGDSIATEVPDRASIPLTTMLEMWRRMLLIRRFEEEATRLLRLGRMPGVLHNVTGQEAGVVGYCFALEPGDYVLVTHRDHGQPIARGAELGPLMAEILGKATGVCGGKGGEMHLIDPSVGVLFGSAILGSGMPVAVGTALTSQVKRTGQVTLTTFGEGAANEGAVHESMNLAAIWKLPIVFVCENNGYAVTVPATYSLSVTDVADRAAGYGMPGRVIDGEDPVAVCEVVGEAVKRARDGDGPSLVEIKTYRTVDHAENLPTGPYRSESELAAWRERDPIVSFRAKLISEGAATEESLAGLEATVEEEIATAVRFALDSPEPEPEALWQHMYVEERLNRPPVFGAA